MHDTIRHGRPIRPGKKGVGHMEKNSFTRDNLWMCKQNFPQESPNTVGFFLELDELQKTP